MSKLFLICLLLLTIGSALTGQSFRLVAEVGVSRHELRVSGDEPIKVSIAGLGAGDEYTVYLQGDRTNERFRLEAFPAGAELLAEDLLFGVATQGSIELVIRDEWSSASVINVLVKRKTILSAKAAGPIVSSSSSDIEFLLNNLFRFEDCFDRTGIRLTGGDRTLPNGRRAAQLGTFSNGQDLIGINTGIMLTTGFTYDAPGPNSNLPASGAFPGSTPVVDQDIQDLVGVGVPYFDAAVLEFSFVPTTDSISFDYVFFSEEYCSGINLTSGSDAFAFILEGPEGRRNIARLDNGDVISPFTLNHLKTPELFIDNTAPGSFDDCAGGPIPPERLAGINYNGFSTRLTAKAKVTPCAIYTLKFLVADAGDNQLDSGVFIEAGALTTNLLRRPEISSIAGAPGLDFTEGCDTAVVTFTRLFTDPNDLLKNLPISFDVITSGGSLAYATRGIDFLVPSTPVFIPAGAQSITVELPILADNDAGEGPEAFILDYNGLCSCGERLDTLLIADILPLDVQLVAPAGACGSEFITVTATASGGDGNYTYRWPDGSGLPTFEISPAGRDTLVEVLVTDGCGNTDRSDILVRGFGGSADFADGVYSLCNRPAVDIPLRLTGSGPFRVSIRETIAGVSMVRNLSITGDTVFTFLGEGELAVISVTDRFGCALDAGPGVAEVVDEAIGVRGEFSGPDCSGAATGSITLTDTSGLARPLSFTWSDIGRSTPSRVALPAGNYEVTIATAADPACFTVERFTLTDPDAILESSQLVNGQTCDTTGRISVNYRGGTGELSYDWSNGTDVADLTDLEAGDYRLTVTDENGCSVTRTYTITDLRNTPDATITAGELEITCARPAIPLIAPAPAPDVIYTWRDGMGTVVGAGRNFSATTEGAYALIARDTVTGCQGISTVFVSRNVDAFSFQLPPTYALSCFDTVVKLSPRFTIADPITYEWRLGGNTVGTGDTLLVSVPGRYELVATRLADGCVSRAATLVEDRTSPPAVSQTMATVSRNCRMPETTLSVAEAGPYSFDWSTTDGRLIDTSDTPAVRVGAAGTYRAVVTDTLTGCVTNLTFLVVDDGAKLTPLAGPDVVFDCAAAGNRLVGASAENLVGSAFRWLDETGRILSSTQTVGVTSPGGYILEAVHPNSGCSSFDTLTVLDEGPNDVTTKVTLSPCPEVGGTLEVLSVTGGTAPFEYSSQTAFTDPSGAGLLGLPPGTNELIITDALGCELVDTFLIFADEPFTGVAPDISIGIGETIRLGATTSRDDRFPAYTWSNLPDTSACRNCASPALRPVRSFTALLNLVDEDGCSLTLQQRVFVSERSFVYLPTAFSPADGNGVNDIYFVQGDAEFVRTVRQLVIYDRWGSQVFSNENITLNDPTQGWDGRSAGEKVYPAGVYVYAVEVELFDGTLQQLKGSFTLLR